MHVLAGDIFCAQSVVLQIHANRGGATAKVCPAMDSIKDHPGCDQTW